MVVVVVYQAISRLVTFAMLRSPFLNLRDCWMAERRFLEKFILRRVTCSSVVEYLLFALSVRWRLDDSHNLS